MAAGVIKRKSNNMSNIKRKKATFITIEGLEGCGKSSVISFLARYLRKGGSKVSIFREPGSTKIGEKIRRILLDKKNKKLSRYTELLLYLAARTQLIEEKLMRAFKDYDFVICDRFFDSTLVYQGYALGLGKIVDLAVALFSLGVTPDLTIVLDADVKKSLRRLKAKDRIESRRISFHCLLKEGYRRLSTQYPERIRLIDADRQLQDIFENVQEEVSSFLWKRKRKRL